MGYFKTFERHQVRVLIACERSGVLREAFHKAGYTSTWSVDTGEAYGGPDSLNYHIVDDARKWLKGEWDLIIAHPPCTHLAVSGARWFKDRPVQQALALQFFQECLDGNAPFLAVENPVSIVATKIRRPDQYVQPWQFGHGETKKTGWWLKNLPLLMPTDIVEGREARVHKMAPSATRGRDRSKTYQGMADAIVAQWGQFVYEQTAIHADRLALSSEYNND